MKLLTQTESDGTENASMQAALRFSTVVLAAILLGMNYGRSLPPEIASLCHTFGWCGMAFYFSLEFVADQRARKHTTVLQQSAEQRLSWRLRADAVMASHVEEERAHGANSGGRGESSGGIENAMDSTVGLDLYLGPTSQPVLSV